jgi:hypothetical protein
MCRLCQDLHNIVASEAAGLAAPAVQNTRLPAGIADFSHRPQATVCGLPFE